MDTNFLALAERPVVPRAQKSFSSVVIQVFRDEHLAAIRSTLKQLDILPRSQKLEHHGLELEFADEADAALFRLAFPPVRD